MCSSIWTSDRACSGQMHSGSVTNNPGQKQWLLTVLFVSRAHSSCLCSSAGSPVSHLHSSFLRGGSFRLHQSLATFQWSGLSKSSSRAPEPSTITVKSIGAHHFHFTLAGSSSPDIRAFRCLKIAQGSLLFFRQLKPMFLIHSKVSGERGFHLSF